MEEGGMLWAEGSAQGAACEHRAEGGQCEKFYSEEGGSGKRGGKERRGKMMKINKNSTTQDELRNWTNMTRNVQN